MRTAAPLEVTDAEADVAVPAPAPPVVPLPIDVTVAVAPPALLLGDPVDAPTSVAELSVIFLLIGMPVPIVALATADAGIDVLVFAGAVRLLRVAL